MLKKIKNVNKYTKIYQKMQTCKIGLKYFCSLLKKFFFFNEYDTQYFLSDV